MNGSFVHLHVASGYSMRYGTARPAAIVERAHAWGQPAVALTDRDGLYGAVKFVQACMSTGVAPILGVDLAVEPETSTGPPGSAGSAGSAPSRTPVRGGQLVDPRLPRVTVLARGQQAGLVPGAGWAGLCGLVTDTHLRGERGDPVTTVDAIARRAAPSVTGEPGRLVVLLGPDSDVGRAVLARRFAQARERLAQWVARLPHGCVVIELVCHGGPDHRPGSLGQAGRMAALAAAVGVPTVLTGWVRHLDRTDAAVVDVLDAARRLVPLDERHLDRTTSNGYLAPTPEMIARAHDVVTVSDPGLRGGGPSARTAADELLARTTALATACIQDPRADLGIGSVQLPEPEVLGIKPGTNPQHVLARRCREAIASRYPHHTGTELGRVSDRLEDELQVIAALGYATYFLTVATVCDLIRDMGVRCAARGSGAGSLVNYLLGISGVDPLRYGLLMERFCSPLRAELPDIDVDVESARRTEIYRAVLDRFGAERVTCVSMMDTYRVRHAIRDVGAALGLPPQEVDAMAKAFPHIAARNVRNALAELPELRMSGLNVPRLQVVFDIVERLDGLPRHIALHPCGVVLSNSSLLQRTPVEASWLGFPMSQFDKDDVEAMGLLKLDILGIRMQSAMAHAVAEVERVEGTRIDLDDETHVPHDDPAAFELIRSTRTLGCFQIESPGQRELIGKFGPQSFEDIVIDISLFRPGPVKSDMIIPFLNARHGWSDPTYLHPSLVPSLEQTEGVVVFHEQVLMIVSETTGVSLAQADEVRRALGSPEGQERTKQWWYPAALARGYDPATADKIWAVLEAFASFGFCKAHAAAFALPTYQSAWLKAHHPAAFLAGVLTHDPGMYPKRLILDDARSFGILVLPLDVNASKDTYRYEPDHDGVPGIRLSLADVHGISDAEVERIVASQPYASLSDFWQRAHVSRPIAERLVLAGAFDSVHGIDLGLPVARRRGSVPPPDPDAAHGPPAGSHPESHPESHPGTRAGLGRRGQVTRRDLLLHVAELDRWTTYQRREGGNGARARGGRGGGTGARPARVSPGSRRAHILSAARDGDVLARTAAQSQAPAAVAGVAATQLALDLDDAPRLRATSGLPEMTGPERVRAELEVLGLDASGHVVDFYGPMLDALGVTRSVDLLRGRSNREVLVAGVKVATQTPPIRSGRRVVFLTLDDATGPVDLTYFEDVQGPYAATVFHSWLILARGIIRRTGPKGVSIRATGAWELSSLFDAWTAGGIDAVHDALLAADGSARERAAAAGQADDGRVGQTEQGRRILVHSSGFTQSPYADIRPAGEDVRGRRGSSGDLVPAFEPATAGSGSSDSGPSGSGSSGSGPSGPPLPTDPWAPAAPAARRDDLVTGQRGRSRTMAAPPRKLWHASPGSSGH